MRQSEMIEVEADPGTAELSVSYLSDTRALCATPSHRFPLAGAVRGPGSGALALRPASGLKLAQPCRSRWPNP